MARSQTIFVILGLVFLVGCTGPANRIDQSNLESVVAYYYGVGKDHPPSGKDTYSLLSQKSRTQIGEAQWIQRASGIEPTITANVLRKTALAGGSYGLVSVTSKGKDGKTTTRTNTWILEQAKWRRLILLRTEEEALSAYKNGDYGAAKAKAEEWLRDDPFSMPAYFRLASSITRIKASEALPDSQNRIDEIVRAVLSINENDTDANSLAVAYTNDPETAQLFLNRLKGTPAYSTALYNFAGHYPDCESRLIFLRSVPAEPRLDMIKAICLDALGRRNEAGAIVSREGFAQALKSYLDSNDPKFSADRAAQMGMIAIHANDREKARAWLEYGVHRDPNNQQLKQLADALHEQGSSH